jgi:hypothetical protein
MVPSDLFRRWNRRLPADRVERMVRRALRGIFGEFHQRAISDGFAQRRILLGETRREVDDAGVGHGAVFLRTAGGECGEAGRGHLLSDQSAIVTSATKAGSRTA